MVKNLTRVVRNLTTPGFLVLTEELDKAPHSSVSEPGHNLSMVVVANSGTSDNTIL